MPTKQRMDQGPIRRKNRTVRRNSGSVVVAAPRRANAGGGAGLTWRVTGPLPAPAPPKLVAGNARRSARSDRPRFSRVCGAGRRQGSVSRVPHGPQLSAVTAAPDLRSAPLSLACWPWARPVSPHPRGRPAAHGDGSDAPSPRGEDAALHAEPGSRGARSARVIGITFHGTRRSPGLGGKRGSAPGNREQETQLTALRAQSKVREPAEPAWTPGALHTFSHLIVSKIPEKSLFPHLRFYLRATKAELCWGICW